MAQRGTFAIDENLPRKARKVATARKSSVNQLVREFLKQVVKEADQEGGSHSAAETRSHNPDRLLR